LTEGVIHQNDQIVVTRNPFKSSSIHLHDSNSMKIRSIHSIYYSSSPGHLFRRTTSDDDHISGDDEKAHKMDISSASSSSGARTSSGSIDPNTSKQPSMDRMPSEVELRRPGKRPRKSDSSAQSDDDEGNEDQPASSKQLTPKSSTSSIAKKKERKSSRLLRKKTRKMIFKLDEFRSELKAEKKKKKEDRAKKLRNSYGAISEIITSEDIYNQHLHWLNEVKTNFF